jgi:hypothetical protein
MTQEIEQKTYNKDELVFLPTYLHLFSFNLVLLPGLPDLFMATPTPTPKSRQIENIVDVEYTEITNQNNIIEHE